MKLFNNFTSGAMNKDVDLRLVPKGTYLDAKNIRVTTPDGQNSYTVRAPLGNQKVTTLSLGSSPECIGVCTDNFRKKIYWAVVSSTGSYICEYDVATTTENIVLSDTRGGSSNIFNFQSGGNVDMRVINDNENGNNYLILTDGVNEPKFFEIEAAKTLTDSSFTLEDVSLIKAPPSTAPVLTLGTTVSNQENNIESKFLSFAYRYKYQNGEFSALSPFSEFAFLPDTFSYNFKEGTNNAMFNDYSKVDITVGTGTTNVTNVQLIVKESGTNTAYIVDTYNKSKLSWSDDSTEDITFDNSRIYKALEANQLTRAYDNVPVKAGALELIGNRIVFGDYTEGYDLTYSGSDTNLSFSLDYTSASGTSGVPHEQVKTNRDYEVAIAYCDGKGRMTTPIASDGNTTYVPYSVADEKVQLELTIDSNSRPPDWATSYRLFIKQSKTEYDVIAPVIFYRDGLYAWIKLEGNDNNKVNEGDFLYVKSDTAGLKSSPIKTKVLEIAYKEENFLESTTPDPYEVLQEAGNYMRLQVDDYAISDTAVTTYEWQGFSFRSDSTGNNILGSVGYYEPIYYEGTDLNDLTVSGAYTNTNDVRYEVEIDGTGSPNTFKWREWNVSDDDSVGSWTTGVSITGSAQLLSNNVSVTFGQTTGHTSGDKWYISAKSPTRVDDWDKGGAVSSDGRRAIIALQGKDASGGDEGIKTGAVITITYDGTASDFGVDGVVGFNSVSLSSSKDYPNLEEWFYGDNIITSMGNIVSDVNDVMFRRAELAKTDGQQVTVTGDVSDRLYMLILSPCNYTGSAKIRIDNSLAITEFDNNIIFETIPTDVNSDIFYELPKSYGISGGVHLGDTNQVYGAVDAVITLDYFNSFGWYNGFESIKIADTFNQKAMVLDTKPLVPVDNYKQIRRKASLTYGGAYESTTQYNSLNEFNLSTVNYKDLDIRYGIIRKLYSFDTDLMVFQHDKTHRVLFNKSVVYSADGTGSISQSSNVLGQEVAYSGEYGIGAHPESFAIYGNRIYHIDKDRGALMRLSSDGYTELSKQGMADYFRTLSDQTSFVGGYDPYNDEYLINIEPDGDPLTLAFKEQIGFTSFYEFEPERMIGINNRLYSFKAGQIWIHDSVASGYANFYGSAVTQTVKTVFNDSPNDVKHFKSVNLESKMDISAWDAYLFTDFNAESNILDEEFVDMEKEYYAYIRQNESTDPTDRLSDGSLVILGIPTAYDTLTHTFGGELPRALSEGDPVYVILDVSLVLLSTVTSYDRDTYEVTLADDVGDFSGVPLFIGKDSRIEGEPIKGHWLTIEFSNSNSTDNQIFAVKVEASKSYD